MSCEGDPVTLGSFVDLGRVRLKLERKAGGGWSLRRYNPLMTTTFAEQLAVFARDLRQLADRAAVLRASLPEDSELATTLGCVLVDRLEPAVAALGQVAASR